MLNVLKKSIELFLRFSQKRSKGHILTVIFSHFIKALIIFPCIYYYYTKPKVENFFCDLLQNKHTDFFVPVYFVFHTPQFKMLVFAFQSEIWIAQNFNFTAFEDFGYRCHGNIDFHKMKTTLNFNPKPTSIANFALI